MDQLANLRRELARFARTEPLAKKKRSRRNFGRVMTAQTNSDVGIVVPTAQYRRLSVDLASGMSRPEVTRPLVEELTLEALQLVRDGFPGAALKLGHDLWVQAAEFPECYELLDSACVALNREPLRRLLREARAHREWCDSRRAEPG